MEKAKDGGEKGEIQAGGSQEEGAVAEEEEAKSKVTVKSGQKEVKVEYLPLDLASFQSTTDFVRAFKEKGLPLHILINNAALCASPYSNVT